jgi:DNA-binding Lrp family transcriptional regulator
MAKKAGAKAFLILPTLKMFKIAVKLDTTKSLDKKEKVVHKKHTAITLDDELYSIIALLQKDIEFISEPFRHIIEALDISYERLFNQIDKLLQSGVLRRFASILNHKKAGFSSNAMVVWQIDEQNAQAIGESAAAFSAVSHCYLRPTYKEWPYNLFTMIHASSPEELEETIQMIQAEIAHSAHMALHSIEEFKKVRILYFSEAFDIYEKEVLDEIS